MSDLVLATRGSPLALWQARTVKAVLERVHPGLGIDIHEVRTHGDREQRTSIDTLSATGVFTKEVDAEVQAGRAHIAVHSLKDQVTTLEAGLHLGMVLARGPVEDAFIGRSAPTLDALAAGARVATGSRRRVAQLRRVRPDLDVVGIRGNVDTRLRKLDQGEADATLLARAGLVRLGLAARITEVLDLERFLPAASQGIVGVTCRERDDATRALLLAADDRATHAAAEAERAWLRALHGGCNVPAGAHAVVDGSEISIRGRVLSLDGTRCLEGIRRGRSADAAAVGVALAEDLLAQGAGELIAASRAG